MQLTPLESYIAEHHTRRSDPVTSHEAAERHGRANHRQCQLIMATLRKHGAPMAAEQIADVLGNMDMVAVCRRLADLRHAGLIVQTEEFHVNRSGRRALKVRLA